MIRPASSYRELAKKLRAELNFYNQPVSCPMTPTELEEIADALELLEKIGRAWHVEGPSPDYHRKKKLMLAKEWPTLYRSLCALPSSDPLPSQR